MNLSYSPQKGLHANTCSVTFEAKQPMIFSMVLTLKWKDDKHVCEKDSAFHSFGVLQDLPVTKL